MKWEEAPLAELVALVREGVPKHTAAVRLGIYPGQLGAWLRKGRENLAARARDPDVELDEHGLFAIELRSAELAVDEEAYKVVAREARLDPRWAYRWIQMRAQTAAMTRGRGQVPLADAVDGSPPAERQAYEQVRSEVLAVLLGRDT